MPAPRTNLGDPDYEPTDEDLVELAHEAFSGIQEAHAASLQAMRERIARLRAEGLARLTQRQDGRGVP